MVLMVPMIRLTLTIPMVQMVPIKLTIPMVLLTVIARMTAKVPLIPLTPSSPIPLLSLACPPNSASAASPNSSPHTTRTTSRPLSASPWSPPSSSWRATPRRRVSSSLSPAARSQRPATAPERRNKPNEPASGLSAAPSATASASAVGNDRRRSHCGRSLGAEGGRRASWRRCDVQWTSWARATGARLRVASRRRCDDARRVVGMKGVSQL